VFLLISRIIRQARLPLALVGLMLLGGCSAIKIGYEQTPTLLYWWLDKHVDFNGQQTPAARQALDDVQRWHRKQALPAYADLLARMAVAAQRDISAAQACTFFDEIEQHLDRLATESIAMTAPVVATLDAAQRDHLERYWTRKNEEWAEEWLEPPETRRLKKRSESAMERYEDFYGRLSPMQSEQIRQHLKDSVWTPQWGQQERYRRQKDLLDALDRIREQSLSASQAQAMLWPVWQRWLRPPAAVDQARMQAWRAQSCRNLAALHNSTSAEQRQKAVQRLRSYEKDLRELAGRS
jgi:Family of unknown function (DUF6279)